VTGNGLPIDRPGKVICIGLNYRDHAAEGGFPIPETPIVFAKWASSLIAPDEPIRIPQSAGVVDYEAELAVVIGERARDVSEDRALEIVAGYTCFNDVTARDVQAREPQWSRAKSFDTFGPVGPRLVPPEELPDPNAVGIRCLLNDEVVQDSSTADMIFSVESIIAFVSTATTLEPGDLIATGTPAGVGSARGRTLAPGDVVTVELDGIGTLANPVT
jgi:2-keto-4-pentenoate hydratase/2-oxohepta-3-ene-1,7-dioic acid hydratase in catechol pathway